MRAKEPDQQGFVVRNGVRVAYEVFGGGPRTLVFLPTWSIVHSRIWKAQVPYFARHMRVITIDGRGNGRSDRPARAASYDDREFAADCLAVLDAVGSGARHPRRRRRDHSCRARRRAGRTHARQAGDAGRRGTRAVRARSREDELADTRLRVAARAGPALAARAHQAEARTLHLLTDRTRSRPARRRHRRRAAQAAPRPADRLARADPVTKVLEARGERIHPASVLLASDSAHMESEASEHDLHCFQAWRRMDEIMVANFMVFHDLVQDEPYDLWVGDEAWEVDYFLHENPEEKRAPYVWLTDFVGWLPMADGGAHEQALTADYNAEMIAQIERFPSVRDRALFVGDPADIVPDRFGPGLPAIRAWTEEHYHFAGYVTGFDPQPSPIARR